MVGNVKKNLLNYTYPPVSVLEFRLVAKRVPSWSCTSRSWRQEEGEERRQEMDMCKQESTEGMEREETPEGNARHTCFRNKALYERTIPIKLKPLQKCWNHPFFKFKRNGRQNLSMSWEAFGKLVALISDLCDNLRVHVLTCGNVYLCWYVPWQTRKQKCRHVRFCPALYNYSTVFMAFQEPRPLNKSSFLP